MRDLDDDQRRAEAAGRREAAAAAGLFQRRQEVGRRGAQRGHQPEDDAGHDRQDRGERHDAAVDARPGRSAESTPAARRRTASPSRSRAGCRARRRRRTSTRLSVSSCWMIRRRSAPSAARTRNLALPPLGARQHQVRQIGAADQQHEADGAQQHVERRPDVPHDLLVIRNHRHRDVRIRVRVLLLEAPGDRVHVGHRAVEGHAGLQLARRRTGRDDCRATGRQRRDDRARAAARRRSAATESASPAA